MGKAVDQLSAEARNMTLFSSKVSRMALGPIQAATQLVLGGAFLRIKQVGREVAYTPLATANITSACSSTFICMVCTENNLSLPLFILNVSNSKSK